MHLVRILKTSYQQEELARAERASSSDEYHESAEKQLGEPVKGEHPVGSDTAIQLRIGWMNGGLQHPDGSKADCHRDTGLDPKTIRKWWDNQGDK